MPKIPYLEILNDREIVEWAKTYLKKRNRVEWYLKLVKEDPRLHPSQELMHFYGMNIPAIEECQVEGPLFVVLELFNDLEEKYFQTVKRNNWIKPSNTETILLNFDDGYSWVNLNKSHCSEEGSAMGHCGNVGGRPGETILSLRKKVLKGGTYFWESHLTFVLDAKGKLGERKGKQNSKPHVKYHPYILSLLEEPLITGVKPGGYLSMNNFSYQDFDPLVLEKFIEKNPEKLSPAQSRVYAEQKNLEFICNCQTLEEAEELESCNFDWLTDEPTAKMLVQKSKNLVVKKIFLKKIKEYEFLKNVALDYLQNNEVDLTLRYEDFFSHLNCSEEQKIDLFSELYKIKEGSLFCYYSLMSLSRESFFKVIENELIRKNKHRNLEMFVMRLNNRETDIDTTFFWVNLSRKYPLSKENVLKLLGRQYLTFFNKNSSMKLSDLSKEEKNIMYNFMFDHDSLNRALLEESDSKLREKLFNKIHEIRIGQFIRSNNRLLNVFKEYKEQKPLFLEEINSKKDGKIKIVENAILLVKNDCFGNTFKGKRILNKLKKQQKILNDWKPELIYNSSSSFNYYLSLIIYFFK